MRRWHVFEISRIVANLFKRFITFHRGACLTDSAIEGYSHFFEVKLDQFNGPIDLLLHLVKQRELPIEQVSLAAVADQYMQCIVAVRDYDLEVAGEYLVIAATLLSIKSSILLNEPVELVEDEEGNLIDPHEELLRRLREAQIYKDGAEHLGRTPLLGVDVFSPPSCLDEFEDPETKFAQHDALLLGKAFKRVLEKSGASLDLITISVDSVSIVDRMMKIVDTLKASPQGLEFSGLIPDCCSKAAIVSTLIACLELCKRQAIHVRQDKEFDRILISIASENQQLGELHTEFDDPKVDDQKIDTQIVIAQGV